jgi:hypothetical protein
MLQFFTQDFIYQNFTFQHNQPNMNYSKNVAML